MCMTRMRLVRGPVENDQVIESDFPALFGTKVALAV